MTTRKQRRERDRAKNAKAEVVESAMIRAHCNDCDHEWLCASRMGAMACPSCTSTNVTGAWGRLETTFVPEHQDVSMTQNTEDPDKTEVIKRKPKT